MSDPDTSQINGRALLLYAGITVVVAVGLTLLPPNLQPVIF